MLKVIESPVHRLLLADEVGLGKTIEAGLIWTELDARSPLKRVLIVAPSGLLSKWQLEMERRFDRETQLLGAADLVRFADRYAERGDSARLAGVVSYAQLRNAAVLDMLSSRPPTFDLAIFDEAHAMRNPSTRTHQAGGLIAENSEAVVFLSATPVNLGSDDLFNLLRLLRPDEFSRRELFASQIAPNIHVNASLRALTASFPPQNLVVLEALRGVETTLQRAAYEKNPIYRHVVEVLSHGPIETREQVVELQEELNRLNSLSHVYTRTRKRDLRDHLTTRRAHHLQVSLTAEEEALYEATLRLVAALRRQLTGAAPGLAPVMPARQASSCLPVMRAYLEELAERGRLSVDLSEGEETDDNEDELPAAVVAVEDRVARLAQEIRTRWLDLDGVDSKLATLLSALHGLEADNGRRRVLLFSFFRLTLDYLDRRFTELGYRCAQMHGGTPLRERTKLLERFRDGDLDMLLCSEVGSEGLDFEFCDVLVNYDLPWNPMRLEQRIGRLDRFGQRHPVIHIFNFEIDGTIDTDIFLRLYQRIGVFEQSIGELEPILGSTVREITRALASLELTGAEQRELANRLALAVESERQSLARFDEEQERLIGADAYVDSALSDARENRRYLTPEELARYVGGFLRDAAHPARLVEVDKAVGTHAMYTSPLLADRLREYARDLLTPALHDLITTLETGGPVAVTFDAERAYESRALFLNARHPLVRAITRYYELPEHQIHPGGYIALAAPSIELRGRWVFYVFLLSATGLVPRRSLVAVAADLDTRAVSRPVGEYILSELAGPSVRAMRERDIPLFDREAALACYEAVLGDVAAEREITKHRMVERNEALISARQESLRRELDVRRQRLRELAEAPGLDDRIRRMRVAQLANLEADINGRIDQLDQQRAVSVSFKVVLGGVADLA